MTSPLTKQKFYPVIAIFVCLTLFGGYVLLSGPAAQKPGNAFAVPPKPSIDEESAAQQQFLIKHYGGESKNSQQSALVARIGQAIATRSAARDTHIKWHFHLLAEANRIDSFAFPGGNVYVTTAMVNRMHTEAELAAVLSNGVAHVIMGHSMHTSVALDTPNISMPAIFAFTREQESATDPKALQIMADSGYNPESMLALFQLLTDAYKAHADVDFFRTHPSDEWRLTNVAADIPKMYPKGVPSILSK